MPRNIPEWESELWHIAGNGNGRTCPLISHCEIRHQDEFCPFDHPNQVSGISFSRLFSTDRQEATEIEKLVKEPSRKKVVLGHIFQNVDRLASEYTFLQQNQDSSLPISPHLIHKILPHPSTEVRHLPLKAYHGAVWHLQDSSVIYVNANDSQDRQRLTLFHEAFHVLLRAKTAPLIQNTQETGGYFTEMLADFFAGCIVMPRGMVKEKWEQFRDVRQLAQIFHVTPPAMWIRLEGLGLI